MDRVCCRRAKKRKKKTFESVLYADEGRGGGGELKRGASDKGSLYAYMIRTRTEPLLQRANRLRFARSSRHAPIQITVHQAAYSRRYGTTPLKLTRRGKIIGESFARSRSKALNIRSGEIVLCYLCTFYR